MKKAILTLLFVFLSANVYATYDSTKPADQDVLANSALDIRTNFAHIVSGDTAFLGTTSNQWSVGDNADTNKTILFNNGETNEPFVRYVATQDAVRIFNNGVIGLAPVYTTDTAMLDQIIKGWVQYDQNAVLSIEQSFNVSSITDESTGVATVKWDTDFSNNTYAVTAQGGYDTSTTVINTFIPADQITTADVEIRTSDDGGAGADSAKDADAVYVIAIGDLV